MKKIALITLLLCSTVSLSSCLGVTTVQQGETGVKKSFGKVDQDPIGPGLHAYNPFTTSYIRMDNHILKYDDKTNVFTKDVQKADIEFAVNYALRPDSSVKMYINVGKDWADVLLPQIVNGSMKNVIGQWNAVDLVSNRDKAAAAIEAEITRELLPYGVTVSGFQLVDIQYDAEFDKAIRDKVIAIQHAQQSQNETVQVTEQAKQTIIKANADADAMKIKSAALSQNQGLVAYEAVQRWDGHLPQVQAGGAGTIFNMPLPGAK